MANAQKGSWQVGKPAAATTTPRLQWVKQTGPLSVLTLVSVYPPVQLVQRYDSHANVCQKNTKTCENVERAKNEIKQ